MILWLYYVSFYNVVKEKITEHELFLKSMEVLGKGFQTLEQYAAKVTLSEKQIIEKVRGLNTKVDLLNLLNALKREDLGKDCYRFTLNQINFYCNPRYFMI